MLSQPLYRNASVSGFSPRLKQASANRPSISGLLSVTGTEDSPLRAVRATGRSLQSGATSIRTARALQRAVRSPAGRVRGNQDIRGSLTFGDLSNPLRVSRFADDFTLVGVRPGNWVTVRANSSDFDAYLQVVDGRTGRILHENDDAVPGMNNPALSFVAKAGTNYRIRVTSYEGRRRGEYSLSTRTLPTKLPGDFSTQFGFGLINASAAVARATNQSAFPDISDLGGALWNLDMIKAPEAWSKGFTGQNVTVAVIDTGVDVTHPDLMSNIWTNSGEVAGNGIDDDKNGFIDDINGWNFRGNSADVSDQEGHGTHVSGTIAALNNGFGITGVAPNAKIMPIKVIDGTESVTNDRLDAIVALAIRYAVRNGANVINMSLGNQPDDPIMPETAAALRDATRAGVVAVMASGNEKEDGATRPIMPALYAQRGWGIAVGAVDRFQTLASFSNPAGNIPLNFVSAPGVGVRSTISGEGDAGLFDVLSGTSMATPHVAGVAALIKGANPSLSSTQIQEILMGTSQFDEVSV